MGHLDIDLLNFGNARIHKLATIWILLSFILLSVCYETNSGYGTDLRELEVNDDNYFKSFNVCLPLNLPEPSCANFLKGNNDMYQGNKFERDVLDVLITLTNVVRCEVKERKCRSCTTKEGYARFYVASLANQLPTHLLPFGKLLIDSYVSFVDMALSFCGPKYTGRSRFFVTPPFRAVSPTPSFQGGAAGGGGGNFIEGGKYDNSHRTQPEHEGDGNYPKIPIHRPIFYTNSPNHRLATPFSIYDLNRNFNIPNYKHLLDRVYGTGADGKIPRDGCLREVVESDCRRCIVNSCGGGGRTNGNGGKGASYHNVDSRGDKVCMMCQNPCPQTNCNSRTNSQTKIVFSYTNKNCDNDNPCQFISPYPMRTIMNSMFR